MILQVKKKIITRDEGISTHHQAPHVSALWHEVTKSLSLVIVTMIVMMSYLLMMKLCKKILTLLKFALVSKKKLEKLKEKLDSSQQAYTTLLE